MLRYHSRLDAIACVMPSVLVLVLGPSWFLPTVHCGALRLYPKIVLAIRPHQQHLSIPAEEKQ